MENKDTILSSLRRYSGPKYEMPDLSEIKSVTYEDRLSRFVEVSAKVGGAAYMLEGEDVNQVIARLYPEAKVWASNLPYVNAHMNPDQVGSPSDMAKVDVGVVEGKVAVAENGCIWVPQTMKERAVCFIAEHLVIIIDRDSIVDNMHQAYDNVEIGDYGYGCFISGPSKTADIAQALVMGAQAARGVTVLIR